MKCLRNGGISVDERTNEIADTCSTSKSILVRLEKDGTLGMVKRMGYHEYKGRIMTKW